MKPVATRPKLAGPSFVWPGDIALNCARLQCAVDEVGLLFFETEACLAYGEVDLPAWLADLPLTYHVHLPLDLPWADGLDAAWEKIVGLTTKIARLSPTSFVLHPPPDAGLLPELARRFAGVGVEPARVLLENTRECDLTDRWNLLKSCNYGVCLDLGHLLAYNQWDLLSLPGLDRRLGMLHLNAPGPGGRHLGLDELDDAGRALMADLIARAGPGCVLMVEIFSPEPFLRSLEIVRDLLGAPRAGDVSAHNAGLTKAKT